MQPTEIQVIPSPIRLAVLTAAIGTGGAFHAPTIGLFKNNVTLNPSIVIGNLTPADFDGYAPITGATWDAPYIDIDGSALVFGASQTIVCTGTTTPNTIFGYYAADSGLTSLKAAWRFLSPVGISDIDQGVSFVPAIRYSGT